MSFSNILTLLTSTAFVLSYLFIFAYLPGSFIAKKFKLHFLDHIAISLILGFSLYSLGLYAFRFFSLPFFFAEFFLLAIIFRHLHLSHRPLRSFISIQIFQAICSKLTHVGKLAHSPWLILFLTIMVTALIQSAVLLTSGIQTDSGLQFSKLSFHDSIQHLTFINRLHTTSQLIQPGFAGALLTNYHYLIDLALAGVTRFSFISLFYVYYRLYPLIISTTFSLMLFVFTRQLTGSRLSAHLSIPVAVFGGNASFFAQFIRGPEFSWGSNAFLINPLVDILQNPASIFVLAQLLATIYLIRRHFDTRRSPPSHSILAISVIAGTMIGFKAWGGLLILMGLLISSIWQIITIRHLHLAKAFVVSLAISLFLFLPHYHPATSSGPVWAPGWSLRVMVNDADRWNYLQDIFKLDYYQLRHHYHQEILLYLKWVLIYILGNYWLRLFGLLAIIFTIINLKQLKPSQIMIISITLASLLLPLFFNQGRMAYDIEQFSPYALLFSSIFTVSLFSKKLLARINTHSHQIIVIVLFLIMLAPSNFTSIKSRITSDTYTIPTDLLTAYTQVASLTPPDATILLYPSERNIATLEFAALTGRNTFYSGRTVSIIVGNDYQIRSQQVRDFFDHYSSGDRKAYARDHQINYLFLLASETEDRSHIPDFSEPIFETKTASLFRLNYH